MKHLHKYFENLFDVDNDEIEYQVGQILGNGIEIKSISQKEIHLECGVSSTLIDEDTYKEFVQLYRLTRKTLYFDDVVTFLLPIKENVNWDFRGLKMHCSKVTFNILNRKHIISNLNINLTNEIYLVGLGDMTFENCHFDTGEVCVMENYKLPTFKKGYMNVANHIYIGAPKTGKLKNRSAALKEIQEHPHTLNVEKIFNLENIHTPCINFLPYHNMYRIQFYHKTIHDFEKIAGIKTGDWKIVNIN